MIKRSVILILLSFFVIVSCKSSPAGLSSGDDAAGGETAGSETEAEAGDELSAADEVPSVDEAPEENGSDLVISDIAEPEADLPEAEEPDSPPVEPPVSARLPEPATPADQPPAEPVLEALSPIQSEPAADMAAGQNSPTEKPEPPAPPRNIRPAEEQSPPPVVREPVPLPPPPAARAEPPIIPIPAPLPEPDETVIFSRIVRATVGQLVEVPFRGTGWVYLGELAARRGITYDSRRLDPEGQSFIFRAEAAGTYALKFYKQDFIRDYILNDHVQVIVGDPPEAAGTGWFNPPLERGRVVAEPRWPAIGDDERALAGRPSGSPAGGAPAEIPSGAESSVPSGTESSVPSGTESSVPTVETDSAGNTGVSGAAAPSFSPRTGLSDEGVVPVAPPSAATDAAGRSDAGSSVSTDATRMPEGALPEEYLRKARVEVDAGRVASAISVLDGFRERFPSGSDEAWWLLGQFYEANSPSRDIRMSLDYYRRLLREYPQSRRYTDAQRRIAYLERYYINIQ
jgi:hypothetical protein